MPLFGTPIGILIFDFSDIHCSISPAFYSSTWKARGKANRHLGCWKIVDGSWKPLMEIRIFRTSVIDQKDGNLSKKEKVDIAMALGLTDRRFSKYINDVKVAR
ncbi:unnamed protein product [Caenorhabditis nigoni]